MGSFVSKYIEHDINDFEEKDFEIDNSNDIYFIYHGNFTALCSKEHITEDEHSEYKFIRTSNFTRDDFIENNVVNLPLKKLNCKVKKWVDTETLSARIPYTFIEGDIYDENKKIHGKISFMNFYDFTV